MNDIATAVKDALAGEAQDVTPPPIDRAGFDAAVRGARRRRRVAVTGIAGVAAACAIVAGYAVIGGLVGASEDRLAPAHHGPTAVVPHPPFLLAGDGVVAGFSDDEGSYGAAGVNVGHIEDAYRITGGLLLVGGDSRLYRAPAESGGNPVHAWTMGQASTLRDDPVQRVVVSRDGRTAAWITLDDQLEVYDLVHDTVVRRADVSPEAWLFAVSGSDVLIRDPRHEGWGDQLHLDTDGQAYDLGRILAGPVDSADLTSDMVELTSGSSSAFIPRTESGAPSQHAWSADAGAGQLSPDGVRYLGLTMEESVDGEAVPIAVWNTADGERSDFTGLPPSTGRASWLDDETVLLSGGDDASHLGSVYVCSVMSMQCGPVLQGGLPDGHAGQADRQGGQPRSNVAPIVPSSFMAAL
jgi:hypothetical protein